MPLKAIRYTLRGVDGDLRVGYIGYLTLDLTDEVNGIDPIHRRDDRLSQYGPDYRDPLCNRRALLFRTTVLEYVEDARDAWIDNGGFTVVQLHPNVSSPERAYRQLQAVLAKEQFTSDEGAYIIDHQLNLPSDFFNAMDMIYPVPDQPPR